jgi:transcriptional regulator with XRE-family HTH domain
MHCLDQFSADVRTARKKKELSQRALAGKLNMSYRTILDLENGKSSPRAETVFLIATYLNISLDAILFDEGIDTMSPTVLEFFSGKTQEEANRYIALCRQADALRE